MPTTGLTVTVAQPTVVANDLAANAIAHAEAVAAAPGRVVLFPELSLTGYELEAGPVDPSDPRLTPLVEACRRHGTIALVGAPTRDGSTWTEHLSMLAVGASEVRVVYHKLHLGGAEVDRFQPGTGPAVVEVDGWRLGLAICKDTGVPEHAARTAAAGIDAYLAGVCEHAADREVVAERAKRIATTHRLWVAVASFAGSTGEGYDPAAGGSGVWRPDGGEEVRAGAGPGQAVTATLSLMRSPSADPDGELTGDRSAP